MNRIRAAWKVLRGEWVAQPRLQFPSVWTQSGSSTSNVTVAWNTPHFEPKAAGRRAVRRHRRALALLSNKKGDK